MTFNFQLQTFLDVPTIGGFFFGRLNVRVIRGMAPDHAPLELSILPAPAGGHEQCHVVGIVTVSGVQIDLTVNSAVTMTVSHWVTVFVYIALYCIDSTVLYTVLIKNTLPCQTCAVRGYPRVPASTRTEFL